MIRSLIKASSYRSNLVNAIFGALFFMGIAVHSLQAAGVSVETIRKINKPGVGEFPYGDLEKDPNGAVEAIRAAMTDPDETTRRMALRLAEDEKFRSQTYIGTFRSMAKDPSENVRSDLISVLSAYKSDGDAIIYTMFRDKSQSEFIRGQALSFLQSFRSKEELVRLANEVIGSESSTHMRMVAAKLLLDSHPKKARSVVSEYIDISTSPFNSEAIRIISKVGDKNDLKRLEAMRDDPKQSPIMKLRARDAARLLSVEMLPTVQERVARLKEIADGSDRTEALWAVAELMSRHDEYSVAALKSIVNDRKHPGYWRVKNSDYFLKK